MLVVMLFLSSKLLVFLTVCAVHASVLLAQECPSLAAQYAADDNSTELDLSAFHFVTNDNYFSGGS